MVGEPTVDVLTGLNVSFWRMLFICFSACAVSSLHMSFREWGYVLAVVHKLLDTVASLVAEHEIQGVWASVVGAHCHCCSAACGIFPDQGI